jgi:hypothetical protein
VRAALGDNLGFAQTINALVAVQKIKKNFRFKKEMQRRAEEERGAEIMGLVQHYESQNSQDTVDEDDDEDDEDEEREKERTAVEEAEQERGLWEYIRRTFYIRIVADIQHKDLLYFLVNALLAAMALFNVYVPPNS